MGEKSALLQIVLSALVLTVLTAKYLRLETNEQEIS